MKIKYYFTIAMVALVMTNCSQEDEFQDIQQSSDAHTLTATIEGGSSRSAVTDGGFFSWTRGDAISVWNGSSKTSYTYSGTSNQFNGSATSISGYAVYPDGNHSNLSGSTLPTVNLKNSYSYGSTNAIMLAKVQGNNRNLSFNHLGGLMRFTIKNIPSNATSFTFTANSDITGNFQVTPENGENVIKTTTTLSSNKTVTITFSDNQNERTFYIPLPVGTYSGFTIQVGNCSYTTTQAINTINRRTLLLMPTFTCSGTHLEKGENSIKLENIEQEMNISGNESLMIETPTSSDANTQLNLSYEPTDNATLNISDGQTGNSTISKAKVVVNVKNNTEVKELNIDAPTLTVELASGEYNEITAKTATQTLIIKSGVTVKNLKVFGGNVVIENGANVQSRTNLRILTFEDKDAKFEVYPLDYADDWSGREITTWSDLIDNPQYGGPMLYGNGYATTGMSDAAYYWYDEGNTELYHMFPDNGWGGMENYNFAGGGHAISNYWGAGYADKDRNIHIAKYYGQDYIDQWTGVPGADAGLGWFCVQLMTPIAPHSGNNFAVHYGYKDGKNYIENLPEISFADGQARVIDHMYVTNTNYTLNQLYNGVKSEEGNTFGGNWTGLTEDAWLKIVAQGFDDVDADAYAEPISEVEFYLVKGLNVVETWQKWDLSGLGAVAKVRFNFLYSPEMGGKYGFTIPGYFAYDDIAVRF